MRVSERRSVFSYNIIWLAPLLLGSIALSLVVSAIANRPFSVPFDKTRDDAICSLKGLSNSEQAVFFNQSKSFKPISRPGIRDWLSSHPEPGQTFDQFRSSRPIKPDRVRKRIYIRSHKSDHDKHSDAVTGEAEYFREPHLLFTDLN